MRILFMGTPDIAAECLKALYAAGHEICGVYTRRDIPHIFLKSSFLFALFVQK